ncbi:hypothetical protein [Kitasatospora sp. NPDC058218]|uniref:hypothetical protein n=1 Tax=Kitasatospora sp. NPDC058218 TaxID=3346385 RepID=UPI0036D8B9AE
MDTRNAHSHGTPGRILCVTDTGRPDTTSSHQRQEDGAVAAQLRGEALQGTGREAGGWGGGAPTGSYGASHPARSLTPPAPTRLPRPLPSDRLAGLLDRVGTAAGVPAQRLRRDRILDEARHTADPVHLVHLLGISVATAVAYTRATHPERFGIDPARA